MVPLEPLCSCIEIVLHQIGCTSLLMLNGHIERLTRHPSGCLRFNSYLGRRATFRLSLSIEPIGQ